MLTIISPAKSLDFNTKAPLDMASHPAFLKEQGAILKLCQALTEEELKGLMGISQSLAQLNYQRFQDFDTASEKQAIFAYNGDVYNNIDKNFNKEQAQFLQEHVAIISGMYGVLKPLDYIRPYRLEMSIKLPGLSNCSLYEFWQKNITRFLNDSIKKQKSKYLINLASTEYSSVIDATALNAPILNIHFKEYKDGKLKVFGINAKRARGAMVDFIVKNSIDEPSLLKNFDRYVYSDEQSTERDWVFIRP